MKSLDEDDKNKVSDVSKLPAQMFKKHVYDGTQNDSNLLEITLSRTRKWHTEKEKFH